METTTRPMTVSVDDETMDICAELRKRHMNRSGIIRDLLRLFRDNGYQMPAMVSQGQGSDGEIGPDDTPFGG